MLDTKPEPTLIMPGHPETLIFLILNELRLIRRAIWLISITPVTLIYIIAGIYLYTTVNIPIWLLAIMLITPATVYFGLDIRAMERMINRKP